ncbi:snt-2 [Symbiodinium microadriaticum]|nr:snt-2 [Symbiodinium microadriaticum]
MAAHRALVGYIAPQSRFPPTFKRTRKVSIQRREGGGTQLEEALKSAIPREQTKEFNLDMDNEGCSSRAVISTFFHPKRLPSFTDRILTKSMPAFQGALRNESFTSGEDAISSDHKPVIATYTLTTYGGLRGIMAYNPNMVSNTFPRYTTNTTYRIKNLKGYNLAEMDSALFGGGSDPYVVLWSDPRQILIGKKLRTPTITHELNPVWTEGIEFRLATNDTTGLSQNAHLFLSVWDFDVTNEDDLIGTFTIALKDLFEHYSNTSGSDFHFRGSLVRNGLHHGEIEGDIELGGRREPEEAHRVKMRKGRTQTLYDALSHRNLGEPTPGTLGCGCNVS